MGCLFCKDKDKEDESKKVVEYAVIIDEEKKIQEEEKKEEEPRGIELFIKKRNEALPLREQTLTGAYMEAFDRKMNMALGLDSFTVVFTANKTDPGWCILKRFLDEKKKEGWNCRPTYPGDTCQESRQYEFKTKE